MAAAEACECGAAAPCLEVWHEVLEAEQEDAAMYPWHLPLVCAFVLQHRSHFLAPHADVQFRIIQFYVDKGVDATGWFARHQVARNGKAKRGFDMTPLQPYVALPRSAFPGRFALSVHDLADGSGGYVGDGYPAYGERMRSLARATIEGWLTTPPRE
ncbi:DUF5946 family protein [Nocardia sp. NPDC051052]|uniref:DUF5946 family protein n=1 Tax=Nocardia sp. NPDC051052 TaxID=3364322 RepID=UPI0037AF4C96